jgi:hypothetical protein
MANANSPGSVTSRRDPAGAVIERNGDARMFSNDYPDLSLQS